MGKKFIVFPLLLSALVFLTMSCGNGGGGTPPAPGTLRLQNNSTVPIDHFYLVPTTQTSWGTDQLSTPLGSSLSTDIVNVPPGTYKADAEVDGTYSIYDALAYGFSVTSGNTFTLIAIDSSFTGSLEIVNNSGTGLSITGLYIVPTPYGSWGPNLIAGYSIGPGISIHYIDVSPDNYDVKAVWSNAAISTVYNNVVSSLALTTITLP